MSDLSNYSDDEIEDAVIALINQSGSGETAVTENGLVSYDWQDLPFTGESSASDRIAEVITGSESIPALGRGIVEDGDVSWGAVPNREADFNVDWDADPSDVETSVTEAVGAILSQTSETSPLPEQEDPSGPDGPRSWRGDDGEAGTPDDLSTPDSEDSTASGSSLTGWATSAVGAVVIAIVGVVLWWRDQA